MSGRALRKGPLLAGLCVLGLAMAGPSAAQEAASGRVKARACVPCHGPVGIGAQPDAPNLAGQPEIYLRAQLKAYRDGKRSHEVMNVIAKPLSDADIADLAAWFASISVEAKEKP